MPAAVLPSLYCQTTLLLLSISHRVKGSMSLVGRDDTGLRYSLLDFASLQNPVDRLTSFSPPMSCTKSTQLRHHLNLMNKACTSLYTCRTWSYFVHQQSCLCRAEVHTFWGPEGSAVESPGFLGGGGQGTFRLPRIPEPAKL